MPRDALRELKLYTALASSLVYTGGSAEEVEAAWMKTLHLAEELGEVDHQLRALWGLWMVQDREALARARQFAELAQTPQDRLMGARMLGVSHHFLGDQSRARDLFEYVIADDVPLDPPWRLGRYLIDNRPFAQAFLARVLWLQGFPDRAAKTAARVVDDLLSTHRTHTLCEILTRGACPIALLIGDLELAERYINLLRDYSQRHAYPVLHIFSRAFDGLLQIRRGDSTAGMQMLRTSIIELDSSFSHYRAVDFVGQLASSLGHAGQIAEAFITIQQAIDRSKHTAEGWVQPELLRIRGELAVMQCGEAALAEAENDFRQSLRLASEQQALAWELRTATTFAQVLQTTGRSEQGLAVLEPIYSRFNEGFDTADLKVAKALMDCLRG